MQIKPPFTELEINKQVSGFYKDNSLPIATISKGIMILLVVWALVFPANANSTLGSLNGNLLKIFNQFYIYIVGFFAFFLLALGLARASWARQAKRRSFQTSLGFR